jgi:hypothetical protein
MSKYFLTLTVDGETLEEQGGYSSTELLTILANIKEQILAGTVTAEVYDQMYGSKGDAFIADEKWIKSMGSSLNRYVTKSKNSDEEDEFANYEKDKPKPVSLKEIAARNPMDDPFTSRMSDPFEENNPFTESSNRTQQTHQDGDEDFTERDEEEAYDEYEDYEEVSDEDSSSKGPRLRKQLMHQAVRRMIDIRLDEFFRITEGRLPQREIDVDYDEDREYPNWNNDAIEMSILDGYVTFEDVVSQFRRKLEAFVVGGGKNTRRDGRYAMRNTDRSLERARNSPTNLNSFDPHVDALPSDDDDEWVGHVPSAFVSNDDD